MHPLPAESPLQVQQVLPERAKQVTWCRLPEHWDSAPKPWQVGHWQFHLPARHGLPNC